jgi:hypothetical protein
VLRDLAQEGLAVGGRHPVARLDPGILGDHAVKVRPAFRLELGLVCVFVRPGLPAGQALTAGSALPWLLLGIHARTCPNRKDHLPTFVHEMRKRRTASRTTGGTCWAGLTTISFPYAAVASATRYGSGI